MSDDLAKEISDLKRRLAELEAKQSAKEPLRPRLNMQKIDWTEGMKMPPDAAQKMAAVVPDVKGQKFNPHAWAQTRMYGPGGFGPPPERMAELDRETRRKEREEAARRRASEPEKVEDAIERALAPWRNKPY
jgi:hypothetical protein